MSPHSPVISVIMATYNGEAFLEEAIASVLGQSFSRFEFIIIDDGSTDGSAEMLDRWAERDSRIRLIRRGNRGLTRSLNEGIAVARGRFIARMDADDICLPERFERQVEYLQKHPDCAAVGSRVAEIDAGGLVVGGRRLHAEHEDIEAELLLGHGGAIPHPVAMFRREAVVTVGGYCEDFRTSQDLDLYLRLASVGRLANLDEVLLHYRRHDGSVSKRQAVRQYRDANRILARAYRMRGRKLPRAVRDRRYAKMHRNRRNQIRHRSVSGSRWGAVRAAWEWVLIDPLYLEPWKELGKVLVRSGRRTLMPRRAG